MTVTQYLSFWLNSYLVWVAWDTVCCKNKAKQLSIFVFDRRHGLKVCSTAIVWRAPQYLRLQPSRASVGVTFPLARAPTSCPGSGGGVGDGGCWSSPNSKHWFMTSFLWRKVPESPSRSVGPALGAPCVCVCVFSAPGAPGVCVCVCVFCTGSTGGIVFPGTPPHS